MISVQQFRELCAQASPEEIVDEVMLVDEALHVSSYNRDHLARSLSATFGVSESAVHLWIIDLPADSRANSDWK